MWNPEEYAKNSDAQLKWAQELRHNLNLEGNELILDVGCGDGKITADFAATLPSSRVLGIDSSLPMVEYAQKTYPKSQYPNLSFACLDARAVNREVFDDFLSGSQFDLVFSNATLHWVEDRQVFFNGVGSILKDGGRLITSCGGEGNAADVLQVFSQLITSDIWSKYFQDFNSPYYFDGLNDYQLWLKESGLQATRLELVPKDMTHRGKESLKGWIRTTWMPFTKRVPEHQRESFIEEFVNSYLAKIPLDSKGLTHVSMVRLEVEAEKI